MSTRDLVIRSSECSFSAMGPFCSSTVASAQYQQSPCTMNNVLHGNEKRLHTDPGPDVIDEAAAAKLWAVYIAEAETYDKALVESWRSDMDGMLIFAGLCSATLTAFIIEGYKSLLPSALDDTVVLLGQISQQLSAMADGDTVHAPPSTTFTPPASSLICNALWFISLGLSLSCALIATLLEQWARDFIHRADMNSSPIVRARIFSYLYYGLKRFNMHTVVEIIPLLLHASLLLFFAGLVAFLAPINFAITVVAAVLLTIAIGIYSMLTLLPLVHLDCPYRTPLSGAFWSLAHSIRIRVHRWNFGALGERSPEISVVRSESIVEAVFSAATANSEEKCNRDTRALIWTVKSLADDADFEPLVESIPDILWNSDGRRYSYDEIIQILVQHPDTQLWNRILEMLKNSHSGLLAPATARRRQINCCKALWAIGSLSNVHSPMTSKRKGDEAALSVIFPVRMDPAVEHYAVSVQTLAGWKAFCSFHATARQLLQKVSHGCLADFRSISSLLEDLDTYSVFRHPPSHLAQIWRCRSEFPINGTGTGESLTIWIERFPLMLDEFLRDVPYIILFNYLERASSLETLPYRCEDTRLTISLPSSTPSATVLADMERLFNRILGSTLRRLNDSEGVHCVDEILGVLLFIWSSNHPNKISIPAGMLGYLNQRRSYRAIRHVISKAGIDRLWAWISTGLTGGRTAGDLPASERDLLHALWLLCVVGSTKLPTSAAWRYAWNTVAQLSPTPATASVIAALRSLALTVLASDVVSDLLFRLGDEILPADTIHEIPLGLRGNNIDNLCDTDVLHLSHILHARIDEGRLQLLGEFLEGYDAATPPFNTVETLLVLGAFRPGAASHTSHQKLFARAIQHVFDVTQGDATLREAIISLPLFDVYVEILFDSRTLWPGRTGLRIPGLTIRLRGKV
ncbi:hypothetical protein DFH06DRAFT_184597 [Mycena polygramma]|nr:hypothetical protein DFH06DRAFT_184597 [Mycena polygramma]